MGLATIDSHSQKELTEIHKIPKGLVLYQARFSLRYTHLKMSKFSKKCMAIRTLSDTACWMSYISL